MGTVAIAANPASGRDIRRFISHATVYSNREKANIVERIILGAYQIGNHKICMMPDSFGFGYRINKRLAEDLLEIPEGIIFTPDLQTMDDQTDTTHFAEYSEKEKYDVLVVLGGDGTSRAAARGVKNIPLISVSTGTNNIYPDMMEGTIVGLAAGAAASGKIDVDACSRRSKCLEIYKNGEYADLALVDVVFCDSLYSSSKAVWERDEVNKIIVTQCHPASIGFSALPGTQCVIGAEDDLGVSVDCVAGEPNVKGAITAGILSDFRLENRKILKLGESVPFCMEMPGMLALDGEKEVSFRRGDTIEIRLTRNGPKKVDIREALVLAQEAGLFRK